MARRSILGRNGWMPYHNFLSIDREGYWYLPTVKQWHWRKWTIWRNWKELRKQEVEARTRYLERMREPRPDPATLFCPMTDADMERARQHLEDMGWV